MRAIYFHRCSLFAASLAACAQVSPQAVPVAVPAAAAEAVGPLALGAVELGPDACPADASAVELDFCRAARRTMRATFNHDLDDTAPLLALSNALETRPALARLQPLLAPMLDNALSRAQLLGRCARPLRQLKRAVQDAYRDPRSGLFHGIDGRGCRDAFAAFAEVPGPWQELVVTVEPLGTLPLSAFRRFCLEDRRLPAQVR